MTPIDNGPISDSNWLTEAADLPSIRSRILQTLRLSLLATVLAIALADWSDPFFTWDCVTIISLLQFLSLLHPVYRAISLYRMNKDLLHPAFVGCVTFIVFHILLNPIAIANLDVFISRGVIASATPDFLVTAVMSYMVVAIAWFSYHAGSCLVLPGATKQDKSIMRSSAVTLAFLALGVGYIGVGMLGNASVLGGLDAYMDKMLHFYERWEVWEDANIQGGFKWVIMMKFLPAGLILLALGAWLYSGGARVRLVILLILAAIANVFLSSATGGRGTTLVVAFYSLPLLNAYVKRFSVKMFIQFSGVFVVVSYVLGVIRAASYFGVLEGKSFADLFLNIDSFIAFIVRYLTNFAGTVSLVSEVRDTGIVWGKTAFAGLTGLFGGPTPLTTEVEMWWRLKGQYITVNPRYGPPGELYFNFGWIGLMIGMGLIGLLVTVLSRWYMRSVSEQGVGVGMMIVFTSFTANFLLVGNLSYIPTYFTFFALPFYFAFFFFRKRTC